MKAQLEQIRRAAKEALASFDSAEQLEKARIQYLGKKGELTAILKQMGKLSAEERPVIGQLANEIRKDIEDTIANKSAEIKKAAQEKRLAEETPDVTMPGTLPQIGYKHPLSIVLDEIKDIFMGMGFDIAEGPEVEYDYYNFEALNIPKDHPARDTQDTFYINENILLRTQTSPVQVRVMEQKKQEPGVLGVVADIIRVKEKYITAVETALGGNIQNIVTEDEHVAKRMIQYLKKNRLGRATFLPLTTVTPKKEKPFRDEILEEDGVLGNVASKVDCDEKYKLIIEYLLGRFLLVDTIDHAMQISKKYQYRVRIVTLEGELFHPGGSLSGGTFKNNSNLLGRRKEQEALEKEKQTIESAIASVKEEIQTAQKQVENFVKDANAKEETVKELELKKNTAQIKYEQAVSVKEQKEKEYRAIANDGKEIENQKALIEDSLSRIDSDLELSKQKEEQAKEQVKLLSVKLDEEREKQENDGCCSAGGMLLRKLQRLRLC